jgi:hypothetical protein
MRASGDGSALAQKDLDMQTYEAKSAEMVAFGHYLRTGRHLRFSAPAFGVEQKFNPYHDDQDGRFTFAPGGARLAISSDATGSVRPPSFSAPPIEPRAGGAQTSRAATANAAPSRAGPRGGIGGNGGPSIYDPMTLQEVAPTLASSAGGAIIAFGDSLLDARGPARAIRADLTLAHSRSLVRQIQAVDPNYRFDSLGVPETVQGQINQLQGLRVDRAAAFYQMRGDPAPLQVEALRFLQTRTDLAYAEGIKLYNRGSLRAKLSRNEAIGNYVDGRVRRELRDFYVNNGISIAPGQSVQVNRRAHDTSEGRYTVPDSRVADIAFDVSLTAKTISTAQVQAFFRSDFRPSAVVIVRPTQIGPSSSYIITKPKGF